MISVIIPLYNKEKIVDKCINAVLSQDYSDFELIIVDDGSTDESANIVSKFKDKRIRFFSKINGGVSDARNFGVQQAQTDNIFFLDADDIVMPNCLKVLFDLMVKYEYAHIYHCNFIIESNNYKRNYCSRTIEGEIFNAQKLIWDGEIFPRPGAMIIKKQCFEKVGLFSTKLSKFEDLDLMLRLLRQYKTIYSPEIVLIYQREFSDLSVKFNSIEKEYAFYLNFKDACFYERLLLSWNLNDTLKERKRFGDNITRKRLLRKYWRYLHYLILAIIISKVRFYTNKIKKNVIINEV
jgi:glycosyltransferase involved in cell wall biosynthesis